MNAVLRLWLLAAAATALSLLRLGFAFGIDNNDFHIPIVLGFAALPQFAADPYILSLRHFVSAAFPLLSLVATEHNVVALFFACLAATHLLTFLALLWIAEGCGLRGWRELALCAAMLVASRGIYGFSPIAGDGMVINYFTHTELAQALALLCLGCLLRGRVVAAAALAGGAFALNAFVGIWMLVPGAAATTCRLAAGDSRAQRRRIVLLGAAAFSLPAAPVAVWILLTMRGMAVDFDYPAFLAYYFPAHYFIGAADRWQLAALLAAVVAAVPATFVIEQARPARLVLGCLVGVFAAGMAVGAVATSPLLLNLCLLRVDGLLVLLSSVLITAGLIVSMRQGVVTGLLAAVVAWFGLIPGSWPLVALGMALLAACRGWPRVGERLARLGPALRPAAIQFALLAAALVLAVRSGAASWQARQLPPAGVPQDWELTGIAPASPAWRQVQVWAQAATPVQATFLVPLALEGFRTGARRRIWVGFKDGATAMWAPQTWHQWHQRVQEVRALPGPAAAMAYACAHGIDYVVLDRRAHNGEPYDRDHAVFIDAWFEVQKPLCDPGGS